MEKMKPGVVILNAARDALVNDDDMKEAQEKGIVRKYVTDFPNYKSANMDGVIAISHLGASTEEAEDNCAAMAASEIMNFVDNGNIVNSVNYPNIDLGVKKGVRLLVLHKKELDGNEVIKRVMNVSKVAKSVTSSKGEYSATLVELEKDNNSEKEINHLPGVLRVRTI